MRKEIKYLLAGILIGGLLVWLLVNSGIISNKSYSIPNSNSQMSSEVIDSHFIEQMIPHHEDAITMAKLALTKSQKPEVKQLAENIIKSQSQEITQMKSWYQNWFGRELPTGDQVMKQHGMMGNNSSMHMGKMGDTSDITNLETSVDFDKEFLEEMIPHHQMAVMMASMLKNGTNRPEMKQLADNIITSQTSEIDQMRTWLKNTNN
jgi:uncharacterized protein (DUF305 family)